MGASWSDRSSGRREKPPRVSRDGTSRPSGAAHRTGRTERRHPMTSLATPPSRTPDGVLGELVTELGGSLGVLLTALGNRCGLWNALAEAGELTPDELSRRTGVAEPLAREWCRAQAAGGYLDYAP